MSGSRPLVRLVVAGTLSIGGYFLLPPPAQNLAFVASNLTAAVIVLVGVRSVRLRPVGGWLLLAGFPIATGFGNAVYFINDSLLHVAPFPSVGDVAFLGGYLFLAAGLLRLQHSRAARRDLPAVLDTAIITIGFTAASWVVFMAPLLHDVDTPVLERLTALGYPAADVLVVTVAARFLLTARRRSPAFGWLAGTIVVMLVADSTFAVLNLLGDYQTGHPIDALIIAYNLGWGAVALHPRAGDLSLATTPSDQTGRPSWLRLAALSGASLIAPVALIVQVTTGHLQDLVVTSAAAAVLFLLVVARMGGLVVQLERVLAQRHALQSELAYRATHDALTGLANRREFTEQLKRALQEHPGGGTSVLFLDLDRFKAVNDSLGHGAGDTLLTVIAERLRDELRAEDTVARLGGDEFAVLLGEPLLSSDHIDTVIDRLAAAVSVPVRLHGLDVQVGVSIGRATAGPDHPLERLLQVADQAMYATKARSTRRTRPQTIRPDATRFDHPAGDRVDHASQRDV